MAETSTLATRPSPSLQAPAPLYGVLPKTSLYVGDLHPEVTEADLIQTFSKIGPLFSVRVCRARGSFKSLCYGYVNFWNPSHASKALASLNHTELKGKVMRIMWCQRDPTGRKNGSANLYVKNLVPSITSAQLEEIFGKYGAILSCKVAEYDGKRKGFGFVQFESEDSAKAAVDALHGIMLEGKKLYVGKFVKKSERNIACTESFTNLYVNNLDKDISEDILREKFSEHGKVSNVVIMKDDAGISKGIGCVQFNSSEEAIKATECMNDALLGSKCLFVGRAQKKEERGKILKHAHDIAVSNKSEKLKASKLYVKNLSVTIDNRKLEAIFCPFGKIISAEVMCDHSGISKGSGVVCFSTPEEARKALCSLNGSTVEGMSLLVALVQTDEKGHRQLRSRSLYHKQSFYSANWSAPVPQYKPIHYKIPYCPSSVYVPSFSTVKPNNLYHNFSKSVDGYFQQEVKNPPMKFTSSKASSKLGDKTANIPVEQSSRNSIPVSCAVTASSEEMRKKRITKILQSYLKKTQNGHGESNSCVQLHTG